jgi:hypothetical protein
MSHTIRTDMKTDHIGEWWFLVVDGTAIKSGPRLSVQDATIIGDYLRKTIGAVLEACEETDATD